MSAGELTENMLRLMHGGNPQIQIMLDWSHLRFTRTESYPAFCELVERGVEWSFARLAENPKDSSSMSENALTSVVVAHLRGMAFDVAFDATVGGHCDLVVTYGTRYMWLGEAKIYSGYSWLLKGYLQLTTRYARGEEGADRGGLLIYMKEGDLPKTMANWQASISAVKSKRNGAAISVVASPSPPAAFASTQAHYRTGRDFTVKHLPLSIVWEPEV